jgi:hypothetical protein
MGFDDNGANDTGARETDLSGCINTIKLIWSCSVRSLIPVVKATQLYDQCSKSCPSNYSLKAAGEPEE